MPKLFSKNLLILLPILAIITIFSTFFYFNQSNSELKPLIADETHDVVVLEECDLVIKYEKKYYKNIKKRKPIEYSMFDEIVVFDTLKKGENLQFLCNSVQSKGIITRFFDYLKYDLSVKNETQYPSGAVETPILSAKFFNFPNFYKEQVLDYDVISIYESQKRYSFSKEKLLKTENTNIKMIVYSPGITEEQIANLKNTADVLSREKEFFNFYKDIFDGIITIQPNSLAPSTPSVKL